MKRLDKKQGSQLIILLSLVYFTSYMTRINYSAALVDIVDTLGIAKSLASIAVTAAFVTYGFGQIISGWLGDRFKPHMLVFGGLLLTSAMNISVSFTKDPYIMAGLWAVNGFAQALMWPPIVRILTYYLDYMEYKKGCVKIIWGSSIATICVYVGAPVVIGAADYTWLFRICGGLALLFAFIFITSYSKITSHAVENGEDHSKPSEPGKQKSVKIERVFIPMIALVCISIVLQGFLRDGLSTWMPDIIAETFNMGNGVSILTGALLPIFAIICNTIAAYVNRVLIQNEVMCYSVMFLCCFISALGLYLTLGYNVILTVCFLSLLSGFLHGVNSIQTTMLPPYFERYGMVAFMAGFLNAFTYIGSASSTYIFAALSENSGWSTTILLWVIVAAIGTLMSLLLVKQWGTFRKKGRESI